MGRVFSASTRITVSNSASILALSQFALIVRFKVAAGSTYRTIWGESDAFNEECYMRLNGGGSPGVAEAWYRTPTANFTITGVTRFDDGAWHTMALLRTGASAFNLLVDGVSQGTSSASPGTTTNGGETVIGNQTVSAGVDEPFLGTLDDIRVYSGSTAPGTWALVEAYMTGRMGIQPLFWMPLGLGSPEPDYSGNAYNGTITGSPAIGDNYPNSLIWGFDTDEIAGVTLAGGGGGGDGFTTRPQTALGTFLGTRLALT